MDLEALKEQIHTAAREAGEKFMNERMGGQDMGACGFAWIKAWPEHKGNTRAGKEERRTLAALGFRQDYDRAWTLWRPGDLPVQSVDILGAAAAAGAKVLNDAGFKNIYAQDRLD